MKAGEREEEGCWDDKAAAVPLESGKEDES